MRTNSPNILNPDRLAAEREELARQRATGWGLIAFLLAVIAAIGAGLWRLITMH